MIDRRELFRVLPGAAISSVASVASGEAAANPVKHLKPVAYTEGEGGIIEPWTDDFRDRPGRLHVIFFEDGSAFDMVNGWRHGRDEEWRAHVQRWLDAGEWREVVDGRRKKRADYYAAQGIKDPWRPMNES